MIGLKDPHENLKTKLRGMPDRELIQFGLAASERCKDRQNEQAWIDLRQAREEWLRRHPRRQRKPEDEYDYWY